MSRVGGKLVNDRGSYEQYWGNLPANPVTTIEYALPEPSQVQLVVYDLAGRTVATLVSGFVDAGYGGVVWQGRDASGRSVPTGIYIYRIVATGLDSGERFTQTRKMVLLK